MKKLPLHSAARSLVIAMALSHSSWLSAHDQSGYLGNASSALDQYQVQCYDDGAGASDHLEVSIKDIAPAAAPKISLQIATDNAATNTTDPIDGDAGYSPELNVKSGGNAYILTVDKTASGAESYEIQYHCMTGDNQHTGTEIYPITNQ